MELIEAIEVIQLLNLHGFRCKLHRGITNIVIFPLKDNYDGATSYTIRTLAEAEAMLGY